MSDVLPYLHINVTSFFHSFSFFIVLRRFKYSIVFYNAILL